MFVLPMLSVGLLPPLDTSGQAATCAIGLRLLSSTYAGNCVQVRRSSDDTTQDIGFGADSDLDTDALLSFCGVGDGFISKWYDQSGNGRDFLQNGHSTQPQLVSAGAVITANGVWASYHTSGWTTFDGMYVNNTSGWHTGDILSTTAYTILSMGYASAGSTQALGEAGWRAAAMCGDFGNVWHSFWDDGTNHDFLGGHDNNGKRGTSFGRGAVFTSRFGSGTLETSIGGGGDVGTTAVGSVSSNISISTFYVGTSYQGNYATSQFKGYINEIIIFNVKLGADDMNSVADNMAQRGGLGWSTL